MTTDQILKLDNIQAATDLVFKRESYDAGHPKCLCSACGFHIPDEIEGESMPAIRLWEGELEAVLHFECFQYLAEKGVRLITPPKKEPVDLTADIIKKGKCCVSDKPLNTCKNLNIIQINKKAKWSYPVWGNFITGHKGMAVAFVHDEVFGDGTALKGEIKYAVEIKNGEIIYHPISEL